MLALKTACMWTNSKICAVQQLRTRSGNNIAFNEVFNIMKIASLCNGVVMVAIGEFSPYLWF